MIGKFGLTFAFSPVEAQWKIWMPSTTINLMPFYMVLGIMDILLDFFILCLPQPLVWKLKMSTKQRLLLSGVFCAGALYVSYIRSSEMNVHLIIILTIDPSSVCVTGIIRVVYISRIDLNSAAGKLKHLKASSDHMSILNVQRACTVHG